MMKKDMKKSDLVQEKQGNDFLDALFLCKNYFAVNNQQEKCKCKIY